MRFVPRIPPPPCPFRVHSCFSWLNNLPASSCPLVSIRGSYSFRHFVPFVYFVLFVVHPLLNGRVAELPRGRAHARHPRTAFSSLFPMKNYSCPFVFIRGSYLSAISCLSCISCFSWLNTPSAHSCPFVFIRGSYLSAHSWFIFSPSLRVHSWPRRTTSAIKKQTGHPRKIIKKVYISTCYSKTSFPYGTSWSP